MPGGVHDYQTKGAAPLATDITIARKRWPCVACRRLFERADFRWLLQRQGAATKAYGVCCECAEVELDSTLRSMLATAMRPPFHAR